jgi:hypothetical protein
MKPMSYHQRIQWQCLLQWLRHINRHQTSYCTNPKRDPWRQLPAWSRGSLNELFESRVCRKTYCRVGSLTHHLRFTVEKYIYCIRIGNTHNGKEPSIYAEYAFLLNYRHRSMSKTAILRVRTFGVIDQFGPEIRNTDVISRT